MNQWPMERLYPLLAGFAVIIIGTGFDRLQASAPPGRILALVLLAGALSWSISEMPKFFERAREVAHTEGESINQHLRDNLVVSRTHSYEYLGTTPYITFGHADPSLENRLIDAKTPGHFRRRLNEGRRSLGASRWFEDARPSAGRTIRASKSPSPGAGALLVAGLRRSGSCAPGGSCR